MFALTIRLILDHVSVFVQNFQLLVLEYVDALQQICQNGPLKYDYGIRIHCIVLV